MFSYLNCGCCVSTCISNNVVWCTDRCCCDGTLFIFALFVVVDVLAAAAGDVIPYVFLFMYFCTWHWCFWLSTLINTCIIVIIIIIVIIYFISSNTGKVFSPLGHNVLPICVKFIISEEGDGLLWHTVLSFVVKSSSSLVWNQHKCFTFHVYWAFLSTNLDYSFGPNLLPTQSCLWLSEDDLSILFLVCLLFGYHNRQRRVAACRSWVQNRVPVLILQGRSDPVHCVHHQQDCFGPCEPLLFGPYLNKRRTLCSSIFWLYLVLYVIVIFFKLIIFDK